MTRLKPLAFAIRMLLITNYNGNFENLWSKPVRSNELFERAVL